MKLFVSNISYKVLAIKSVAFLIPWSAALWAVDHFWPEMVEFPKIITNIFSNSIVFLLGYLLTMIGFRYSSKEERKNSELDRKIDTRDPYMCRADHDTTYTGPR